MRQPGGDPLTRRRHRHALSRFAATPRRLVVERNADATDYLPQARAGARRPGWFFAETRKSGCPVSGHALQSSSTTWFGILSRVAEGLGPLKPQQPVAPRDAGANSHPVRPGEIRSCACHTSSSLRSEEVFLSTSSARL